jgi:hypothetical protein
MKKNSLLLLSIILFSNSAIARDDVLTFPLETVMAQAAAQGMIDDSVKYYFGKTKHPKDKSNFGTIKTNKKTNAFNKTDSEACNWAFLSAIKAFHQKAKTLGANAVINIQSNYKNNLVSSETEFNCGAGTFIAGVALSGEFIKF